MRTPIKSSYRGYTLFTMPPASSGGITMTETLNILENFAPLPPFGSVQYTHLLTEAYRRSFTDRNEKLGDPAFIKVPLEQLTSKDYAKTLAMVKQIATDAGIISSPVDETKVVDTTYISALVP